MFRIMTCNMFEMANVNSLSLIIAVILMVLILKDLIGVGRLASEEKIRK